MYCKDLAFSRVTLVQIWVSPKPLVWFDLERDRGPRHLQENHPIPLQGEKDLRRAR